MENFNFAHTLAEVSLEVANYYPDDNEKTWQMPRAEWRWETIRLALEIINKHNITSETEDIDEIVTNYLAQEECLS